MDLYTHIIIRLPYIINMAPYTETIKRHHTAALKQAMGYIHSVYKHMHSCKYHPVLHIQ